MYCGGLAQMVERMLSMHEAQGSIPWSSTHFCFCGQRDESKTTRSPMIHRRRETGADCTHTVTRAQRAQSALVSRV